MIAIIDYGAGNLRSVRNALIHLGYRPKVTTEPNEVIDAEAVVFPGVGAAADAMRSLTGSGMDEAVRQCVRDDKPLFAVCVGMQILLSTTEEGGTHECLGVIPGQVKRLTAGLKVPHMGWNQVKQRRAHRIFKTVPDESNFYFVHSYYVEPDDGSVIAATTEYGTSFCSVITYNNLVATQFHPEKSGDLGMILYRNFLEMAGIKK